MTRVFALGLAFAIACAEGGAPPAVECPADFQECDQDSRTQCETDITSTPEHCGGCGNDCEGSSCTNGACDPALLVTAPERSPSGLAAIGDGLVWTAEGGSKVRRYKLGASAATTIASVTPPISPNTGRVRLEVDASHAWWLARAEGTLRRVALTGGDPETIVTGLLDFDLQGDDVVWFTADGKLVARARAGGAPRELETGLVDPRELVADAAGVYWIEGMRVVLRKSPENEVFRFDAPTPDTVAVTSLHSDGEGTVSWVTASSNGNVRVAQCGLYNLPGSCGSGSTRWPSPRGHVVIGNSSVMVRPDGELAFITSEKWTDRVGEVVRQAAQGPYDGGKRVPGHAASELAGDPRSLYWANIETGFLYRVVR